MKELLERIIVVWCRARHNRKDGTPNITPAINGKYTCLTCHRQYSSKLAIPEDLVWEPEVLAEVTHG